MAALPAANLLVRNGLHNCTFAAHQYSIFCFLFLLFECINTLWKDYYDNYKVYFNLRQVSFLLEHLPNISSSIFICPCEHFNGLLMDVLLSKHKFLSLTPTPPDLVFKQKFVSLICCLVWQQNYIGKECGLG